SRFKNLYSCSFWLNVIPYKFLLFQSFYGEEKTIFYQANASVYKKDFSGFFKFQFTNLILNFGLEKQIFYREKNKGKIIEVTLFYSGFNYNFTDKIFSRIIVTYYKGSLGFYPLFTYQLNPFTVFYLGANINTTKYGDLFKDKESFKIEGEDHQIFLKFQYLLKI
ncbi:MAG: hypothetical protein ABIM13_06795, partial [candidate division WOR-3 bacterium]